MRRQRIVAQHSMPVLKNVHRADDRQGNENDQRNIDQKRPHSEDEFQSERRGDQHDERVNDEPRLQRQQQCVH